jgi:hypothetical protein
MEVPNCYPKEETAQEAEHRIAEISVEEGHCAWSYATREAIPHYDISTAPQCLDEGSQVGEVVAVVGIAYHNIASARRIDAA